MFIFRSDIRFRSSSGLKRAEYSKYIGCRIGPKKKEVKWYKVNKHNLVRRIGKIYIEGICLL